MMKKYLPSKTFFATFFKYTTPVIIQSLVSFFIGLVDTLLVSGLTNEAVSATYAVNQLTFLFNVLASGIIMGASIYLQQFFGAKDHKRLVEAHRMKLVLGLINIVLFCVLAFFIAEIFVGFYARNDANKAAIIADAAIYAPLIILSYIPLGFSLVYTSTFREIRKTSYPMTASIIALVINVGLGYLLIYQADLGIQGAAIATLVSRIVEFLILLLLAEKHRLVRLRVIFKDFYIEKQLRLAILKKGLPLLINQVAWSVGMVALTSSYSERANVLSALNVFNTSTNIFSILYNSLSVGVTVMVGNVLGEGKSEEAKENARRLLSFGLFSAFVFGIILVCLSGLIPQAITAVSEEQKALASQLLIIYGVCLPFFIVPSVAFNTMRTGGKAKIVLITDLIAMWAYAVPIAWALILWTDLDLVWIYLIVQLADVFKAVAGIIMLKKVNWSQNLTEEFVNETEMIV